MRFLLSVAAIVILMEGQARGAGEVTRLLCEWKKPSVAEEGQSYILEVDLGGKAVLSTIFINGVSKDPQAFEIRSMSDISITAVIVDSAGRLGQGLTVNRVTGEAVFHHWFYGAARHSLWNTKLSRMGGFEDDPVMLSSSGLNCRNATRKF